MAACWRSTVSVGRTIKQAQSHQRWISTLTNSEVRNKRNELFINERKRQEGLVTRVEKIEVELKDPSYGCTLLMNKHISTPFNCAMHINQILQRRTALALVNGSPWDMHRPFEDSCTLEFLHFRISEPQAVNKAYWRSCSFLLGMALERAFKDNIFVELYGWPGANVFSGSFIYDVDLKMEQWNARQDELQTLTVAMGKISQQNLNFERMQVDVSLALKMFEDNRYKSAQIPEMAKSSADKSSVTMYRLGDHIDVSCGPMVSHTGLVGQITLASVHPVKIKGESLLRFQGVSLPTQLMISQFAYGLIKDRAKNLNHLGLSMASAQ